MELRKEKPINIFLIVCVYYYQWPNAVFWILWSHILLLVYLLFMKFRAPFYIHKTRVSSYFPPLMFDAICSSALVLYFAYAVTRKYKNVEDGVRCTYALNHALSLFHLTIFADVNWQILYFPLLQRNLSRCSVFDYVQCCSTSYCHLLFRMTGLLRVNLNYFALCYPDLERFCILFGVIPCFFGRSIHKKTNRKCLSACQLSSRLINSGVDVILPTLVFSVWVSCY